MTVDYSDLIRVDQLGSETIAALIDRGLISLPPGQSHVYQWVPITLPLTPYGSEVIRDGAGGDVDALWDLRHIEERAGYHVCDAERGEFTDLVGIVRRLWIEVLDLRAKVAAMGKFPGGE